MLLMVQIHYVVMIFTFLKISDDGIIEDIGFEGTGCAISKSSGSLLTTSLIGKKVDQANSIKDAFIQLLTESECSDEMKSTLGKLTVFEGVKEFPIRVKCATLIWRAFESAVDSDANCISKVSTE